MHVPILSFANSITVLFILNYLCLNPIVYPLIVHIYGYDIIKYSYSKLRIAFNNVYRRLLGFRKCDSASQMYVSHDIDISLMLLCEKKLHGFMKIVCNIDNTLVKSVISCVSYISGGIWQKWISLLYTFCIS